MKIARLLAACFGALFLAALGLQPALAAPFTVAHDYVVSGGPIAAGAAGAQLGSSGFYDLTGATWSVTSANALASSSSTSNGNGQLGQLVRSASEASTADEQVRIKFVNSPPNGNVGSILTYLRYSGSPSTYNGYLISAAVKADGSVDVYWLATVNGTANYLGSVALGPQPQGVAYNLVLTAVQTSSTTTTLTAALYSADGATLLTSGTKTDTTAALQQASGRIGISQADGPIPAVSQITTYNAPQGTGVLTSPASAGAAAPATSFAVAGPTTGAAGVASSAFTVTANGPLASSATVTVSATDGSTSPSPVTLAAGSTPATTFTYTPASAGSKTLSFTNDGGLTNPSPVTYTATAPPTTIPTSSAAFHFSPATWTCYKGRACPSGASGPRASLAGAYFCVAWNASASPTAQILLPANSLGATVVTFLNGVRTANVSASGGPITLSGVTPSATNQLMVVLDTVASSVSNTPTDNVWGLTGSSFNGLEVDGLQVDGASSAGTAPAPCQPSGDTTVAYQGWGLLQGDSIDVGWTLGAGGAAYSSFTQGPFWMMAQELLQQGYDYANTAVAGDGVIVGARGAPAYYWVDDSGVYQPSQSRWNLVDAGVSMLDTNGHLSAYGATGTEAAFLFTNEGTNENDIGYNGTRYQRALNGMWTAFRAAAPQMKIGFMPGFYASSGPNPFVAVAKSAATAQGDPLLSYRDLGQPFTYSLYHSGFTTDGVHPTASGNALYAPRMTAFVQRMLGGGGTTTVTKPTFRPGFH